MCRVSPAPPAPWGSQRVDRDFPSITHRRLWANWNRRSSTANKFWASRKASRTSQWPQEHEWRKAAVTAATRRTSHRSADGGWWRHNRLQICDITPPFLQERTRNEDGLIRSDPICAVRTGLWEGFSFNNGSGPWLHQPFVFGAASKIWKRHNINHKDTVKESVSLFRIHLQYSGTEAVILKIYFVPGSCSCLSLTSLSDYADKTCLCPWALDFFLPDK